MGVELKKKMQRLQSRKVEKRAAPRLSLCFTLALRSPGLNNTGELTGRGRGWLVALTNIVPPSLLGLHSNSRYCLST